MQDLEGKKALVTGGSRCIGFASAMALAQAGCDVVINHWQDSEHASEAVQELQGEGVRAKAIEADVSDPRAVRQVVRDAAEWLGGLDVCHSNAGICRFKPFLELTDEDWERHNGINYFGGFYVGQEAAKIMVEQGRGGRIIFTTSVGAFRSEATQTHYCATKGGLQLLALGMAIELAPYDITVNCLAPGWIHTDINDEQSRDEETVREWLKWNGPKGRLGKAEDCAPAVLFFASDASAYVTGATINVDGGWLAKL
jgi:NAD(P)-dependent dehydrogenase (short-subunit alcohol dehydrogenase family)